MKEIYLDNSATTRAAPAVADIVNQVLLQDYGNPSALHRKGIEAERYLHYARQQIATLLGAHEGEVYFTSSGTEANNLAIKGAARRYQRRGRHLVTTKIEHPSVLNCFRKLEEEGFEVTYLPVNREGRVELEELANCLSRQTILVSIGHINSEIGTVQPLAEAAQIIKQNNSSTLFHVDAVQSLGKTTLLPRKWDIDLLTLSAHKLHGPKGVGGLCIRQGTMITPLLQGGGQEDELRPGTENVAGIAGFGKAVELYAGKMTANVEYLGNLKKKFYDRVKSNIPGTRLNGPPVDKGAPHILNLSFPGLKGEVLLHALEEKGIFVSTGSACHSRHPEPSHVLQALGLSKEEWEGALRFSFSPYNSEEEIDYAATTLKEISSDLQLLR